MSGMSGLEGAGDGIGALLAPIFQIVALVLQLGATGALWLLSKFVRAIVSTMLDVKEDATLWELLKGQPKETVLAAAVTAFCVCAPLWATFVAPGRRREREEQAKRDAVWRCERAAEKEKRAKKSAKDRADQEAIKAEAEASEAAYRSRNDNFASRQPPKPLGGLSGICTTTIASPVQPTLGVPSNDEFRKNLHVDADDNNSGCDVSCETAASLQQGRRWPATSLALALSGDGATIFAGEGGTRACGTSTYTNTASYSHSWPEWKDPASSEAGGRRIVAYAEQGAKHKPTAAFNGHTAGVCALALSADGCTLYSASADHSIKAWDPASGKCTATFGVRKLGDDDNADECTEVVGARHTHSVNALAISANGSTLFSASHDGRILAWALPAGRVISTYGGGKDGGGRVIAGGSASATPGYFFNSLLASVDGQRLYAWGHTPRTGPSRFDGATGTLVVFLVPGASAATNQGLYPRSTITNGNWQTLSDADFGLVQCDRFHTSRDGGSCSDVDVVLNQPIVSALAESKPNGSVLYAGIGADIARVPVETADFYEKWATRAHRQVSERKRELPWPSGHTWSGSKWLPEAHNSDICALVVSLDGGTLFSASADRSIKAWSLPASEGVDTPPLCTATFTGHTSPVLALQLHPDGKKLVSAAHDMHKGELVLKVWA